MKIVMLTPYLPYPLLSGGQIRTYNLLKQLSSRHEVTLFSLIKNPDEAAYVPELEKYCAKVRVFQRSEKPFTLKNIVQTALSTFPFLVIRNFVPQTITAIDRELATGQYDLIHAETFYMMPHLPKRRIPTILVEQTIEYLGYESYAAKVKWPWLRPLLYFDIAKIKRWEFYYWKMCDRLIVMSEEDKKLIAHHGIPVSKIEVVANGVDSQWFAEKPHHPGPLPTLLFVGTFKWLPNVEAVTFLVDKIWPLVKAKVPTARLWIVGTDPTSAVLKYQEQDDQITVSSNLPDIRDAFTGSHVLVAPVFSGKGTRYKILEAMASRTPVVATPMAVEGLGVAHQQEVMVGQTAEELADLTVKVLQSPKLQEKLAKAGQKYVTSHFEWRTIADQLDQVYHSLAQPKTQDQHG